MNALRLGDRKVRRSSRFVRYWKTGSEPAGFQTIQARPKDWLTLPAGSDASNRRARRFLPAMIGGGTWEGAHVRHEAARIHHAARRRGTAWPIAAWAQQPQRMRRIGVLDTLAGDDPEASVRHGAFMQGLQELGWGIGRNVRIDTRWAAGDPGRIRSLAVEIVATGPDVIFTSGFSTIRPLLDATSTLPIVFANVVDPVGAGFVASLARPGGNVTGFASYEFGFPIKWLELLKQIAPGVTRAAVLRDPTNSALIGQFAAIQGAAPSFGVEVMPIDVRDGDELQRAVASFLRGPNDGLIVLGGPRSNAQRDLIAAMVAGHRIPAVYAARYFVTAGGLISYGPDFVDQYRRAAGYVDRILKGEKPANLPVQAPTKHELVINLKTAKALGLDVPPSLLARADEVIE